MNTTPLPPSLLTARQCRMQGRRVCLEIDNSRWLSFPASKLSALDRASQGDLELIRLAADGRSIHWDKLGVILSVEDIAERRFSPVSTPAPVR